MRRDALAQEQPLPTFLASSPGGTPALRRSTSGPSRPPAGCASKPLSLAAERRGHRTKVLSREREPYADQQAIAPSI